MQPLTDISHSRAIIGHQGNRYVWIIASVAALSGLLFGFDIAVINGALIFLRDAFHLTDRQTELAASSLLFGCIGGAAIAGSLTDRYGRKALLSAAAILFGLSSLASGLAQNFVQFETARIFGGIAIGIGSMLAPLYIAEASPASQRGRLVSFNQMAIVTGILIAYSVNWFFSLTGPASWRWMFAIGVVPSFLLFLGIFFVPESPRWLMEKGREDEALAILERIQPGAAHEELNNIHATVAKEQSSFRDLLAPSLRRPLFLMTVLAILQQVTGINTILFYGSLIWEQHIGSSSHSAAIGANVSIGLINFLSTLLALWLIERLGRKPLLLFSCGCMALCQLGLAISFILHPTPVVLALGCMLLSVAMFAIGLGPCTWVLMAELLPTRVRGRAMSVANVALWLASFLMTATFLTLSKKLTIMGVFMLYSAVCIFAFLFIWYLVPETKGKTLEQIEESWLA